MSNKTLFPPNSNNTCLALRARVLGTVQAKHKCTVPSTRAQSASITSLKSLNLKILNP